MPPAPDIRSLPLAQIRPDPTQSRTSFDPAELDSLKHSLQERGLINPISVRQSQDNYEIIAGERRYRAAAQLGWKEILCRVWPADTPALETELLSLVENLQRVDLNPIEEARGYKQLTQPPYKLTLEAIGKEVGKGRDLISRAISLLELAPEVQDLLARANISPGHARSLGKITNVERQIALATQAANQGWSVRELERRIKGGDNGRTQPQPGGVGAMLAQLNRPRSNVPKTDPLELIWAQIKADDQMSGTPWAVTYQPGEWAFNFKHPGPAGEAEAAVGAWFRTMSRWFGTRKDDASPAEMDMMKQGLASAAELKAVAADAARLPKTREDWAELEAAAKKSLRDFYLWIYGPDSEFVPPEGLVTWDGLGYDDPVKGARTLVEEIKEQQSGAG